MNHTRLLHLITVLERVPAERFDMAVWVCGTVACAAGHAAVDPEFNKQGLHMRAHGYPSPTYNGNLAFRALSDFFELSSDQSHSLFGSAHYEKEDAATTQDVIDRIKEMLDADL